MESAGVKEEQDRKTERCSAVQAMLAKRKPLCRRTIVLGERRETYCMRPLGHDEKKEPCR
jgi:hypothetical protein